LYDAATMKRLLIVDASGQPVADKIAIEPIEVR
jgi:hypothetical protein